MTHFPEYTRDSSIEFYGVECEPLLWSKPMVTQVTSLSTIIEKKNNVDNLPNTRNFRLRHKQILKKKP